MQTNKATHMVFSGPTTVNLPEDKSIRRLIDLKGVELNNDAERLFSLVETLPPLGTRIISFYENTGSYNDFEVIRKFGGEEKVVFPSLADLETVMSKIIISEPIPDIGTYRDDRTNVFYVWDSAHPKILKVYCYVPSYCTFWWIDCFPIDRFDCHSRCRFFLP